MGAPLPLLEPTLHMVMLPAASMLLIPLELSTLPRERLRLNQRLMLMLSTELMDMVLVLDTLPDGLGYSRPIYGGYSTISSYAAPAIATGYAGLGYSRAIYGGYGSYYGKRDAEAEPEAEADAAYGTYGGYGLGLGYSSYAAPAIARTAVASYATPAVAAYAAPTVAAPVISRPAIASYAAPAIATGYAGIARPAISSYAGYGYGRLY